MDSSQDLPTESSSLKFGEVNEILPFLYLGNVSYTEPETLQSHGFTHVLAVDSQSRCQFQNKPRPGAEHIRHCHVSVHDCSTEKIVPEVLKAAEAIKQAKATDGAKILVHCSSGYFTSPAIVAAYLMLEEHMRLEEAMALIMRARPVACPTSRLMRRLEDLDVYLFKRKRRR
ncbi:protein-tyrosine phosphatase-like protein [Nemania abortiva]|nr:protein-tyrosine phosphatase-like protein [Nemania abortiva]